VQTVVPDRSAVKGVSHPREATAQRIRRVATRLGKGPKGNCELERLAVLVNRAGSPEEAAPGLSKGFGAMPRVKPESFDPAVKHLFRHFDDVQQLKRNSIARPFLSDSGASVSSLQDRGSLKSFQTHVLRVAREIRDEGLAAGNDDRHLRQFELFDRQYGDRRRLEDVAKELGLSLKHCYRERSEFCRKVGKRLLRSRIRAISATPRDEGFYILLHRTLQGESADIGTLRALESLQRIAEAPYQEISVLHQIGILRCNLGMSREAEAAYSEAERLFELQGRAIPPEHRIATEVSRDFLAALSLWCRGEFRGALDIITRATASAAEISPDADAYAQHLWLTAHFGLATCLFDCGDLGGTYDALVLAASRCDSLRARGPIYLRIQTTLWKLRSYLLASRTSGFDRETRVAGLLNTYRLARDAGYLDEALCALLVMTECHVFARRDDAALSAGRAAIALANLKQNPAARSEAYVDVAARLLRTKFWQSAVALLSSAGSGDAKHAANASLKGYALALSALRSNDFQTAWTCSGGSRENEPWDRVALRQRIVGAQSLFRMGRIGEARDNALTVLEGAERLGAAPILTEAAELAYTVFGGKTFADQARELARLFET
jgi:hypothetical protein